jgi:hypothetical protein
MLVCRRGGSDLGERKTVEFRPVARMKTLLGLDRERLKMRPDQGCR